MLTFYAFFQKIWNKIIEISIIVGDIYKIKKSGLHSAGGTSLFETNSSGFKLNTEQTVNNLGIITLE